MTEPARCPKCRHVAHESRCEELVTYSHFPESGVESCDCIHVAPYPSAVPARSPLPENPNPDNSNDGV